MNSSLLLIAIVAIFTTNMGSVASEKCVQFDLSCSHEEIAPLSIEVLSVQHRTIKIFMLLHCSKEVYYIL